ncbi:unnamed protein product, partial [Darwinula stevensoni]
MCLTDYPKIEHAAESFDGWTGKHPAPRGGIVNFSCKHPRGFKDGRMDHQATCSSSVADTWCATFIENEKDLCPPPQTPDSVFSTTPRNGAPYFLESFSTEWKKHFDGESLREEYEEVKFFYGKRLNKESCVTQYPSMENATVTYDGWDGKYPAPQGSRVIYTCPKSLRFNDGSEIHNATCSSRINDAWDSSFHDRHVRCQEQ